MQVTSWHSYVLSGSPEIGSPCLESEKGSPIPTARQAIVAQATQVATPVATPMAAAVAMPAALPVPIRRPVVVNHLPQKFMPCPYPARSAQAVPQTRVTPVGGIKWVRVIPGVPAPRLPQPTVVVHYLPVARVLAPTASYSPLAQGMECREACCCAASALSLR
ncbi:MDR1 [Symbiodinium natans]|uniref:MDR1 protein n=1 Tax=Symbiodinium natans TaxID=878477 RepID=A0A812JB41_9DINO|nr:MDR1 [Symbiodinium natans]